MQQILPPHANRGGGDAAPADSRADASVRPAGRPARTRLTERKVNANASRLKKLSKCSSLITVVYTDCALIFKNIRKVHADLSLRAVLKNLVVRNMHTAESSHDLSAVSSRNSHNMKAVINSKL